MKSSYTNRLYLLLGLALVIAWASSCSIYEEPKTLSRKGAEDLLVDGSQSLEYITNELNESEAMHALDLLYSLLERAGIGHSPSDEADGDRDDPLSTISKGIAIAENSEESAMEPFLWVLTSLPQTVSQIIHCKPNRLNSLVDMAREFNTQEYGRDSMPVTDKQWLFSTLDFIDFEGDPFEGIYTWSVEDGSWTKETASSGFSIFFPNDTLPVTDTLNMPDTLNLSVRNFTRETFSGNTFVRSIMVTLRNGDEILFFLNYSADFLRGSPDAIRFNVRVGEWVISRRLYIEQENDTLTLTTNFRLRKGNESWMSSYVEVAYSGSDDINPYIAGGQNFSMGRLEGYSNLKDLKVEYRIDAQGYNNSIAADANPDAVAQAANKHLLQDVFSYPNHDRVGWLYWDADATIAGGSSSLSPYIEFADKTTLPAVNYIPASMLVGLDLDF